MESFFQLSKRIYNTSNLREVRRLVVFMLRVCLHYSALKKLQSDFEEDDVLRQVTEYYPFAYEQPTRAFFYHRSTFDERMMIVRSHMSFLRNRMRADTFLKLYRGTALPLWRGLQCMGKNLTAELFFEPGQRKEGILSVTLRIGMEPLYQIIFWIAPSPDDRKYSMWIGAMQGPNMADAKEVVKQATKVCHSYRTKNLVLYVAQAAARALELKHIYAVTNEGYYANNHVRVDRKLKTDFSTFWEEAGGHKTIDPRFYELPLVESRKTIEEVPTRKRAVYRRRFQMLDEIDAQAAEQMSTALQG
ncbi:VirK/YbjX family protein [Selenomonas sp. oral taxon 137]|uniref:VirK/YbjX family protein n=1 Tax=Selenomonas sp. oral taxon 137 TaxID=712531 RepID=UPI00055F1E56|nr:VirK/YbjX family protein [Selenomonas sp. oral taxon 137]